MSKNLIINGVTYNGIESMEIPDTNGEKVVFVPEDEAGVQLPDLGDYPATAEDIVLGKKAIDADGNVMEGTLEEYLGDYDNEGQCFPSGWSNTQISAKVRLYHRRIYGPSQDIDVFMESSAFGDATPEDVLEGRTFTSAAGLKQVGTRPADGGGSETVFYTYVNWSNMVTIKMRVPYDGITWREYVTYDECGIDGAAVEYDLLGNEQVRVGTSLSGYPVYLVISSPDELVPIYDTTNVVEFVP